MLVADIDTEVWPEKLTVPAKPFKLATVSVELLDILPVRLRLVGADAILKSPLTVTVTVAERVMLPLVPVTVIVYVPGVAPPALMSNVDVADPPLERVALVGQSETTGPEGDTEADNETVPEKPLTLDSVTVELDDDPARVSETLDGLVETLKSWTWYTTVVE